MSLTALAIGAGKAVAAEVGKNVGITQASSGMDIVRATVKTLAAVSDGSLVGVTQSARVEPLTLIDSTLNSHPSLTPLLQCMQSCFAAYWMQALAMTTDIGGISVAGKLDPLSTNRSVFGGFANENYDEALPMFDGSDTVDISDNDHLVQVATESMIALEADGKSGLKSESAQGLGDASNLVAGKLLNVTISHNNSSATIPVAIRLMCTYMNDEVLAGLVAGLSVDNSFSERLAQLRHGGISFWRDFVLCQDIIDEHKKNIKGDKTGIYLTMMQRRAGNNAASLTSGGKVSLNNASSILVIAKETLDMAQAKSGYDFDVYSQRQKVFQEGYMMLVAVVDRRWSRVTIYTRGIKETTTVSFADLKSASKGDGPDVADILSAFRAGTSAVL